MKTREEKIKHLMQVVYPPRRRTMKSGKVVKNWTPPNARIFLTELNEQPDNVIDTFYHDAMREAAFQEELRQIRAAEKAKNRA